MCSRSSVWLLLLHHPVRLVCSEQLDAGAARVPHLFNLHLRPLGTCDSSVLFSFSAQSGKQNCTSFCSVALSSHKSTTTSATSTTSTSAIRLISSCTLHRASIMGCGASKTAHYDNKGYAQHQQPSMANGPAPQDGYRPPQAYQQPNSGRKKAVKGASNLGFLSMLFG